MADGMKLGGRELLIVQAIDYVARRIETGWAIARIGESPIEDLFYWALEIRCTVFGPPLKFELITTEDERSKVLIDANSHCLICEPQVTIGEFRVDFVIYVFCGPIYYRWNENGENGDGELEQVKREPHWRKLVVECDGHEFHERTKEQAAADKSRDRVLVMQGYDVFRFTGSELWNDAWGCANQVYDWALSVRST
jgi:very-short-patch-repair endonuclease